MATEPQYIDLDDSDDDSDLARLADEVRHECAAPPAPWWRSDRDYYPRYPRSSSEAETAA